MTVSDKDKIIREISKDLHIREDAVKAILDRFQDIAIERIVNDGKFRYSRFFTITSNKFKAYKTTHGEVPEHYRLTIKLSDGIKHLFKEKQHRDINVSKDNWKILLAEKNKNISEKMASENSEDWNPLLDEDD